MKEPEHDLPAVFPPERVHGKNRVLFRLILLIWLGICAFCSYYLIRMLRQDRLESHPSPRQWVNLEEPGSGTDNAFLQAIPARPELRIAIAPIISPEKSLRSYEYLVDYMATKVERTPVLLKRRSYADVNELIRSGRCDVAFVCTYSFVRGERDFGLEILAVPEIKGSLTYNSLILVPANSQATSLLDLRGGRFASADLLSNSGWLYPASWLMERGISADSFFGDHLITGSHDRSIHAVEHGLVDGAAVDAIVFDMMASQDLALVNRIKIILKSQPFGMPPMVCHPQIAPDYKGKIRDILLAMDKEEKGQRILAALGMDRFVVPDPGLYDSVRRAAIAWETRK